MNAHIKRGIRTKIAFPDFERQSSGLEGDGQAAKERDSQTSRMAAAGRFPWLYPVDRRAVRDPEVALSIKAEYAGPASPRPRSPLSGIADVALISMLL